MSKKIMPQQRTALDMILAQEGHGGMSPEALILHQKQADDAEKMEKRMGEIEKKVDSLDKKVDDINNKVDEVKSMIAKRSSFTENLKEVLNNKVFIYILLIATAVIFGIPVASVGKFLFGG